jgi:hypothetical protein
VGNPADKDQDWPHIPDPEDCRDELGYLGGVQAEGPGEAGGGQDHGALRLLRKEAELIITVRLGDSDYQLFISLFLFQH